VVSAGRLDDQKNFPLLIRAFAEFHKNHPDYSLIIYGEGHRRPELEQLAGQCLHEGSWSLPGKVDDLPFRISRCEIFALSSDYEGVPNVLIEAMAVGTPAVSTDCAPGGAASLIRNGENGLLVPTGNVRALAEGLSYLADHPAEASAMAAAALTVRTTLDAEKVTADWFSYLKKCAERTR
ncbi:MAG: glycosyltransferase, partial [Lentisphaeria bacterium]|nr:glycosyltransferase [Lentisphaeria bacterium]